MAEDGCGQGSLGWLGAGFPPQPCSLFPGSPTLPALVVFQPQNLARNRQLSFRGWAQQKIQAEIHLSGLFFGHPHNVAVSVRKTSVLKLEPSGPITGDLQFSFGDSSSIPHPEVCSPYAKRSGGITAFIGTWVPE